MKVKALVARLRLLNKYRRGQPPYNRIGTEPPFTQREIGYLIDDAIEALDRKQAEENPSRKTHREGRKP